MKIYRYAEITIIFKGNNNITVGDAGRRHGVGGIGGDGV